VGTKKRNKILRTYITGACTYFTATTTTPMSSSKLGDDDNRGGGVGGKRSDVDESERRNSDTTSSDEEREFEIIDMVWDFCNESELGNEFEDFIAKNIGGFRDMAPIGEEQQIVHMRLHEEILEKCEKKVAKFVASKGRTVEEFVACCRKVLEQEDADEDLIWFVKRFLSCLEYETFHEMAMEAVRAMDEDSDSDSNECPSKQNVANRSSK